MLEHLSTVMIVLLIFSSGAARHAAEVNSSFAFDDIYWRFIDPEYFGKFTSIEERIELLSLEERDSLEDFVRVKLQQAEVRTLDEYRTLDEILAC